MISFGIALLCTTAIMVIFRELSRYNISLFRVITVNYWVCVSLGMLFTDSVWETLIYSRTDWIPLGFIQGCLFISLFFLIGQASQKIGVAYTAMITKVSVIFPVLIGVWVFHEKIEFLAIIGIFLALVSVILLHLKYFSSDNKTKIPLYTLVGLSAILFFGSGTTDSIFSVFRHNYAGTIPETLFSIAIFGIAGTIGLIVTLVQLILKKQTFGFNSIGAGIILGVPNYFSIYFLMDALKYMPGAIFFPLLNISILVVSALIGYFRYEEKFTWSTGLGLLTAVAAIFLISYEEIFA